MAFTVEDGTGVEDANSYTTVAFADAYATDRGLTTWTGAAEADQEIALIKATDYIEGMFGHRFKSTKTETDQDLEWPRSAYSTTMPTKLQQATVEYAIRALSAELAPDPTVHASGRTLKASRKKLGPMEKEEQFVHGTAIAVRKPYPKADAMLRSLLKPSNRVIR